ncbi:MAG: hypothetical protein NVSMB16_00860 [Acidimicrobiales bacterium]
MQRVGQTCTPSPVNGRVDAQRADGSVAGSTHTDGSGDYSLILNPGQYTLVVVTGATYPRCPSTPVTVTSGPPTRTDIACDTGMR